MLPLSLLMAKSVRVLFRKKSFGTLTMGSSILIFGLLFLMWYMSRHQQLRFMTSDGYQHLQFTMECEVKGRNGDDQRLVCKPDKSTLDRSTQGLSPSEAVFSIVNSGYIITESEEASKLALLLSSVMMNGLPLLGLDDFVYFSDFVNEEIGSDAKMALLSSPGYKHKFSNFLQVRHNRILLYPDSCWARQFVSYMKNATATFSHLTVSILRSEQQALHHCCHDVWAIIEIQAPIVLESGQHKGRVKQNCAVFDATDRLGNTTSAMQDSASSGTTVVPEVTIRMHPAAVPDTRNFEYSPLNRHLLSRQQSGQLLYFTSGFLTLQLEVQNFLASSSSGSGAGLGGREVRSKVFSGHNAEAVLHPALAAHSLAQALAAASTTEEVQQAVLNATRAGAGVRPTLAFPLFHRAFPTHNNHQSLFWHTFGALTSIGLILYFCLPAAITAGELSRERACGQLDVLSTLPGVRLVHSVGAWCAAVALWVGGCTVLTALFFAVVLNHSSVLLPSLTLLLLGLTLGPMSMLLCLIFKSSSADAVVVAVPTLVFITLLPGLLYFELAFDVQRSVPLELALCLLPASATALILRTICGYEAINAGASWTTRAAISDCPLYVYVLMLLVDLLIYSALTAWCAVRQDRSDRWNGSVRQQAQSAMQRLRIGWGDCWRWLCCLSVRDRGRSRRLAHLNSSDSDIELVGLRIAEEAEHGTQCAALSVQSLTKTYSLGASEVVVLSEISANLHEQCVTLLLGSNGAGKTTLMRVLAGLDSDYSGRVQLLPTRIRGEEAVEPPPQQMRSQRRRVGWCPQNDALFENLTVLEHLQLVASIVNNVDCPQLTRLSSEGWWRWVERVSCFCTGARSTASVQRKRQQEEQIEAALAQLDMLRHCHKRVGELSGGMKRRLSLSLSFLGDPSVLLLDEPTSGCDAHTRDLVRQDILSRRGGSAILISTHHTDDVDVLADRIWFLSERYLEVDEAVENLAAWRSKELQRRFVAHNKGNNADLKGSSVDPSVSSSDSLASLISAGDLGSTSSSSGSHAMEFSTHDVRVKRAFMQQMGPDRAASWLNAASSRLNPANSSHAIDTTSPPSCAVWIVPVDALPLLRRLLAQLEGKGLFSWSVTTCSTYSMLCHLYDNEPAAAAAPGIVKPTTPRHSSAPVHRCHSDPVCLRRWWAVVWVRYLELRHHLHAFLLSQLLLPFLVVFAVAWSCRDVVYPKTELTSREIDGLGEMCVSEGAHTQSNAKSIADVAIEEPDNEMLSTRHSHHHPIPPTPTPLVGLTNSQNGTVRALQAALNAALGADHVLWQGRMGSDAMWQGLFDAYYAHEQPRWAAVVVDDLLERWIESTVVLGQGALRVDFDAAVQAIQQAQDRVCNETLSTNSSEIASLEPGQAAAFCGALPALRIDLLNRSRSGSSDAGYLNSSLVITSYESVRTNVTLLSNVTTDHAAPIYLKEVVPVVYSSWEQSRGISNREDRGAQVNSSAGLSSVANYRLYSHPLPLANEASEVFLQRGYVGSTIVLLYALITTVTCVRSVITQRRGGTKTQLHLAGVHPATFWLGNFTVDALLCTATLCAVTAGIAAGGAPISDYLLAFPPFPGVLLLQCIVPFAFASVASSYTLSVISQDPLAAQMLLLISAVSNGMFLKLFLDRHAGQVGYRAVTRLLLHTSPAFTFSTAVGNLIALHALEVSAAAQGKAAGPNQAHLMHGVHYCGATLLVQAGVYLALCVAVDVYSTRISAQLGRWCWAWTQQDLPAARHPSRPADGEDTGLLESEREATPNSGQPLLLVEAKDLVVQYPRHHKRALDRASFRITCGERVALLGMNGGGKSSLFRTLALAENTPVSGRLSIDGVDAVNSMWRLSGRATVGYVPQDGGVFEFLTVEQTLQLFAMLRNPKHDYRDSQGVGGGGDIIPARYSSYFVHTLSGGTRKKLAVRAANAAQPSLLLLDECTTGVDPVAAERIVRYLKQKVGTATQGILFASHRVDESLAVCDRVLLLDEGRVVLDAPIAALHDLAHRFYHVDIALPTRPREQFTPITGMSTKNPAPREGGGIGIRSYGSLGRNTATAPALLSPPLVNARDPTDLDHLLLELQQALGGAQRVVKYTASLARVTWARSRVPLSQAWELLAQWQAAAKIQSYAFRSAATEEVLAERKSSLQ